MSSMAKTRSVRPVAALLYEGRDAELIWAYRRALAVSTEGAAVALGFACRMTDERFASKHLDTCQVDDISSSAWDLTSSD